MNNHPVHVWINRAGPSRIHAMRMLKNNPDNTPVVIHATRADQNNPSQKFCDIGGTEPTAKATDDEYAAFAMEYVIRHGIQVIIPTARIAALASIRGMLTDIGCTVMAPTWSVAQQMDSKSRTYAAALELGLPVPPHMVVSSAETFYDAVIRIRDMGFTACVKPDTGWAASAFRIIEDDVHTLDSLLSPARPAMDLQTYTRALEKAQISGRSIPELIVMPVLSDPEVSVDTVADSAGEPIVSVPRSKQGFYRIFKDDAEILEHAHRAVRGLPLPYLSNVQFRYFGSVPFLLEINPRASAGLFHTEASGANLYWEAVRHAFTGERREVKFTTGGRVFLQETAVSL